jgi:hypothetical protein
MHARDCVPTAADGISPRPPFAWPSPKNVWFFTAANTLIGRPAKPTERLCKVVGNARTIIKQDSEHKLRPRIALLGQWPRQPHRGRVIASLMCNDSILERPRNGCRANHSKCSHEHAEERPSL